MNDINYKIVKNFVSDFLRKKSHLLSGEEIEVQLIQTKTLLSSEQGAGFLRMMQPEFTGIETIDWSEMKKDLETVFNVKMDEGFTLEGITTDRDKTWWTGKVRQENDNFYWNRYREYLGTQLPGNIIRTIDKDTDTVMNNIENPELETFERYGMVVGHVQSGKTSNYAGLICKAADAGYKFIVVIAGGMDNLRDQTQKRLLEAFVGHNKGNPIGAGIGNFSQEKQPISLTTIDRDFNKADADKNSQGINLNNTNSPILLVIKKNTSILKNVTRWLKSHYKNKIAHFPMLVIDDESDYASVNTKDERNPTAINREIRNLLKLFYKSSYVAYTATPYANIFIDHRAENEEQGKDLFPKDFIHALDAPTNYFGAEKIFGNDEETGNHITEITDNEEDIPLKHKKDLQINNLPDSLREALRLFVLNIAVRHLRGQSEKHNSMLIHVSINTGVHQSMSHAVENYLEGIKKSVLSYGKLENSYGMSRQLWLLKETYDKYYNNLGIEWNTLSSKIHDTIESILIREVHQKSIIPLEYREDIPTNAIVIGGASLSRGYTLEGLSVTYFLRTTLYYDTLMQMGRWFGYRNGYEDLCRIYMTEDMVSNFRYIYESTRELIDELKKMSREKKTPEEFGLAVRMHPDSALQITARNKQKNARDYIIEMDLGGTLKQTTWLVKEPERIENNVNLTRDLIRKISSCIEPEDKGNKYLWRNIDRNIVLEFISSFAVYQRDSYGFSSHLPLEFIKEYMKENDTDWDIALYSRKGNTDISAGGIDITAIERKLLKSAEECYNLKMLSGSSEEGLPLKPEELEGIEKDRVEIRNKRQKPLLMLYFLKGIREEGDTTEIMAAYGLSFPNKRNTSSKPVKVKINPVFLENLLAEQESEEEEE